MPYTELANSTFLDFDSYRSTASVPTNGTPLASFAFNVALVLDRANDPTALLAESWGARQHDLKVLNDSGTLWSTYGANQANYDHVLTDLAAMGIRTVDQIDPANGYVSSAAARTIWVRVDESNFTTLFGPGATVKEGTDQSGNTTHYWDGNLSLPSAWVSTLGVHGLWFDTSTFKTVLPNPGSGAQAALPQGWQSLGNAAGHDLTALFPNQMADTHYNFPLAGKNVSTGTIGLVEPGVGTALPAGSASFQELLDHYRTTAGAPSSAPVYTVDGGGQTYPIVPPGAQSSAGERSLDVGVVAAIVPNSPLVLYAGSGTAALAGSSGFTAYQSAFWDLTHNPHVITSSFGFQSAVAPGSPFHLAASELFIDAALRNITVLSANGDGGSGNEVGNGVTNVAMSRTSSYGILVGGTSLSTVHSAVADATLDTITAAALAGDHATIWTLIAGGLTEMPTLANGGATLVETVWNNYFLAGTTLTGPGSQPGFLHNNASSGGVDPSQPTPSYQRDFGLTPTTSDPEHLTGRGVPDVAANAGGNMFYKVPGQDMTGVGDDDGTSAATPLWAALVGQLNAIFEDQGLPDLGYMNDLLYMAAAIAPASFNDITLGNNTSSFYLGGPISSDGTAITPTGFGYSAAHGYDLTTGLGTSNGLLLARALSAIAHQQISFSSSPAMLEQDGSGGWATPVGETLLVQTTSDDPAAVKLLAGTHSLDFTSMASATFAWTSMLAQQSLQGDFDPNLVRMFDKHAQGALMQSFASAGDALTLSIDGATTHLPQVALTSAFGFADFVSGGGDSAVHVARAVAVGETAGGLNDQTAIVRVRQNGEDTLSLQLYRVDDLNGTIGTLHPGDAGYEAAAAVRAYATSSGGRTIDGPGYGNFAQTALLHVNAGDLIAMKLTNASSGNVFWAFSQANESTASGHVGHLWNYGLNAWGWEDTRGGGDHDYNDLIVGLDFTSAVGHGWLA
ncbi:hypothetical protein SAMN02990966_03303 [Rhodospirillales bacterium URHD0017]|nr:hypothetical protein SAMN02990966_03303 [Rhodospirillales bacterium URHD0017]